MVEYTDYDIVTREVIQSGFCPNSDCLPPQPDGTKRLFGVVGQPERDIVMEDGKVVKKEN